MFMVDRGPGGTWEGGVLACACGLHVKLEVMMEGDCTGAGREGRCRSHVCKKCQYEI